MDLYLTKDRFIFIGPATARKEMKLMAIAAGAMAAAGIAGIDPERDAV